MAQGIDVVVCGSASAGLANGAQAPCTMSDGLQGVQQIAHLSLVSDGNDVAISGGAAAGLVVGGAVFAALAVAFGLRALRRFIESAGES
jgi:hypothetical protein